MDTFTYQEWKKHESEQRIINVLSDGDKSYSELLVLTGLSKPILSKRLKSLENKGKIESIPDEKAKRFLYHLNMEKLNDLEHIHIIFHKFSEMILKHLGELANNPSISDEEYANRLLDMVNILFNFRLLETIVAPEPLRREFIRYFLGPEFVEKMPKLIPENRNIMPFLLKGVSPEEKAIYEAKNAKEAKEQLFKMLKSVLQKMLSDSKFN